MNQVKILRDIFGIPHIYGENECSCAYGVGYTQAEDRAKQLVQTVLAARGNLAATFGESFLEQDFATCAAGIAEKASKEFLGLSEKRKAFLESFASGVIAGLQQASWKLQPQFCAEDVCRVFHYFSMHWTHGSVLHKLNTLQNRKSDGVGMSNQWAVKPNRTANGAAMLMSDPHLEWDGPGRFWEFRTHVAQWSVCGFAIPGTPLMVIGHNRKLGWACTTGGPDVGDIFRVECKNESCEEYECDEEILPVEASIIEIPVKQVNGPTVVRKTALRTHHGPVLKKEGSTLYACKSAYESFTGLVEQLWQMNISEDMAAFEKALQSNCFPPQNLMYADSRGDIGYVRAGRTPIRPEGVDHRSVLNGNTRREEWSEIYPKDSLCRAENPTCGWMQNCNTPPAYTFPHCGFSEETFPSCIVNASAPEAGNRGRRLMHMLETETRMDAEKAMGFIFDTVVDWFHGPDSAMYQRREIIASMKSNAMNQREKDLFISLENWDGDMRSDSREATLMIFVWEEAVERWNDHRKEEFLSILAESFKAASARLESLYGDEIPVWGELNRIQRPESPDAFVSAGGIRRIGMTTLWPIGSTDPDMYGKRRAIRGSCATILMEFTQPVRSWSLQPYGQSDDASSPFYFDQARELMAKHRMKPTYFATLPDSEVSRKYILETGD